MLGINRYFGRSGIVVSDQQYVYQTSIPAGMFPGVANVADPVNRHCELHTAESILPPEPEDPNDMVVEPENPGGGEVTEPENPPEEPDGTQPPPAEDDAA